MLKSGVFLGVWGDAICQRGFEQAMRLEAAGLVAGFPAQIGLHQREGLEAGDKRAGRRRGQGEKASDKYAYP